MLEKKYQVFVSATYEDLKEERIEVLNGILEAGCFPASMELIYAHEREPWEQIEKLILECDYVVLVSAGKYGSYFDENGKKLTISYTENEFNYAQRLGKPIFAFIHASPDNFYTDGKPDKSRVEEPGSIERNKLAAFHKKLYKRPDGSSRTVSTWTNKDTLKNAVFRALVERIKREKDPSIGWIHASEAIITDPKLDEKLKEMQKKYFLLEANNTMMQDKINMLEADKARLNELVSSHEIGSIVQFGGYDWRVLDVKNNRALILCERIIEEKPYHHAFTETTWLECDLRGYLNETFYNRFSSQDKARIAKMEVKTSNNPWFGTVGGDATNDMIFLLSIEEVVQYFGDSGQLKNKNPNSKSRIDDQYNSARIAYDKDGKASWWWLRSPGITSDNAALVLADGALDLFGSYVDNVEGGVRPALWLNPKSGIF